MNVTNIYSSDLVSIREQLLKRVCFASFINDGVPSIMKTCVAPESAIASLVFSVKVAPANRGSSPKKAIFLLCPQTKSEYANPLLRV